MKLNVVEIFVFLQSQNAASKNKLTNFFFLLWFRIIVEKNRRTAKTTQNVCPVLLVRNINVCAVLVLRANTANTVGIKDISYYNKTQRVPLSTHSSPALRSGYEWGKKKERMTHNAFKTHILGFINHWGRKLTKTKHILDRWLKCNN